MLKAQLRKNIRP